MRNNHFCSNLLVYDPVRIFGKEVGAMMIALSMLYFVMSLVIIYFIKRQEYYARAGNDAAVKSVIFPVFVNMLWLNALVNIFVGWVALIFTFEPFDTDDVGATLAFSIMFSCQHAVTEGVAFLLMQKGMGVHAAYQAGKKSCVWGLVTFVAMIVIYKNDALPSFVSNMTWQVLLLIFYGALWLMPQKRLFRRPAAIFYGKCWALFRISTILSTVFLFVPATKATGTCFYVFVNLIPFALLEPLLLYYTLLQDSRWWQGMDIQQGRRVMEAEQIRAPLQGIDLNLKTAQHLAMSMDQMSTLSVAAAATLTHHQNATTSPLYSSSSPVTAATTSSSGSVVGVNSDDNNGNGNGNVEEKRISSIAGSVGGTSADSRRATTAAATLSSTSTSSATNATAAGAVRLLNFAYISLDKTKQLGSGSFSRVYLGAYRQKPCAVKLIFTLDLTLDTIRRVAAEAQLLSLVRHPHVVDILGVSVLPPSVCILLELCSYGSLGDVLKHNAAMTSAVCSFAPLIAAPPPVNSDDSSPSASSGGGFVLPRWVDNSSAVTVASMRGYLNGFNSFLNYNKVVAFRRSNSARGGGRGTAGDSSIGYDGGSVRSISTNTTISVLMGSQPVVGVSTTAATAVAGRGGAAGGTLNNSSSSSSSSISHQSRLSSRTQTTSAAAEAAAAASAAVTTSKAVSLSWSDRLYIAVGCARGLVALHTFSTDLCHRDIKSFNFLIDSQLNAKISDLELGMAELLENSQSSRAHSSQSQQQQQQQQRMNSSSVDAGLDAVVDGAGAGAGGSSSSSSGGGGGGLERGGRATSITSEGRSSIAGSEILANWAAPEVMHGGSSNYTQSADVYSFGLVLWEILTGKVPFSDVRRQEEIRRLVMSGERPLIPACFLGSDQNNSSSNTAEYASHFAGFIDLVRRCWAADSAQRPRAVQVLSELEALWQTSYSRQLLDSTDAAMPTNTIESSRDTINNVNNDNDGNNDYRATFTSDVHQAPAPADVEVGAVASPPQQKSSFLPSLLRVHRNPLAAGGRGGAAAAGGGGGGGGDGTAEYYAATARRVLQNLRAEDDGSALHRLESSGGMWVLLLPSANDIPPVVVWATHTWCRMAGCSLEEIQGKSVQSLPIFDDASFTATNSRKSYRQRQHKDPSFSSSSSSSFSSSASSSSCCGGLWATFKALCECGDIVGTSAREENAAATSRFFSQTQRTFHSRSSSATAGPNPLHAQQRVYHAVIDVFDNNCRALDSRRADKRNRRSLGGRLLSTMKKQAAAATGGTDPSSLSSNSNSGSSNGENRISAKYSVHGHAIYQRAPPTSAQMVAYAAAAAATVTGGDGVTSPVSSPPMSPSVSFAGSAPRHLSGLLQQVGGSFSSTLSSSLHPSVAATSPPPSAHFSSNGNSRSGSPIPDQQKEQREDLDHPQLIVALVAVQFTCLQETPRLRQVPAQLLQPSSSSFPHSASSNDNSGGSSSNSGGNAFTQHGNSSRPNSGRILSTTPNLLKRMSSRQGSQQPVQRPSSSIDGEDSGASIEIVRSDSAAATTATAAGGHQMLMRQPSI